MTPPRLELISRPAEGRRRRPTPLLFVHGAFAGAWCWDEYFLPWFAGNGYDAHALSLRGHGASSGHERLDTHGIADYVADVAWAAGELEAPPLIVGHSMGGFVAQKYAEAHEVAGLVLMASVPPTGLIGPSLSLGFTRPDLFWHLAMVYWFGEPFSSADKMREAVFSPDVPRHMTDRFMGCMNGESVRANMEMSWFARPDIGRLRELPLMVLGAEDDALIPPAYVKATAGILGVEAAVFGGLAHGMMLEPGWEAVAGHIHDWLAAGQF